MKAILKIALMLLILLLPSLLSAQTHYDDSPSGLKRMIGDAVKLAKENKNQELVALTSTMVLPDASAWFPKVFGAESGAIYAENYAGQSSDMPNQLASNFQNLVSQGFSVSGVSRFTNACDADADETEYPVLDSRLEQEPLSPVTFRSNANGRTNYQLMRFFAYVDGAFRFVGNLPPYPGEPALDTTPGVGPVKPGHTVVAARIIKQVPPVYPPEARRQLLQGQVLVRALITIDGVPSNIRVMKGQCIFVKSALAAIGLWRYSPTFVDGLPMEVDTAITVSFSLP